MFWQQTLKPDASEIGMPRLVWPGDPTNRTVKNIRSGLAGLGVGLNLTVRNVATHSDRELTEQDALEQLGAYSHFARLLDQCQIQRSAGCPTEAAASASQQHSS